MRVRGSLFLSSSVLSLCSCSLSLSELWESSLFELFQFDFISGTNFRRHNQRCLHHLLSTAAFIARDMKGQSHIMEIELPPNYPKCAPYVSADVPYVCDLQWSTKSRLKDVVHQFKEHLEKMQDFWSSLSDIDRALLVIDPKLPTRATSFRLISLGDDSSLLLSINVHNPKSLPECRFLGPDSVIQLLRKTWVKNSKRWMSDKPFPDNLANILETTLPGPPQASKDDQQVDCGICYALYLPIDDELGSMSGSGPDYSCDNRNCSRAFHTLCLRDWLRSITTTRQSFDVLFGNCPYCSEPVAVKVN